MRTKTTMSFTITEANKAIITMIAERDGCSASQVVNKAVEVYALYDQQSRELIKHLAEKGIK